MAITGLTSFESAVALHCLRLCLHSVANLALKHSVANLALLKRIVANLALLKLIVAILALFQLHSVNINIILSHKLTNTPWL